jgi:endogenous inhibitor of DNA gyrase (YacG/DUF329 family)
MQDNNCPYCGQPLERSDYSDYDWFCDNPECEELYALVFLAE